MITMATMSPKDRRAITQRTGARVRMGDQVGTATGHYDDDIVFVQFDDETETARVWTTALKVVHEEGEGS